MNVNRILNAWLRTKGATIVPSKTSNELSKYFSLISQYIIITLNMHLNKYIHYIFAPNKIYCYISNRPCKNIYDITMIGLSEDNIMIERMNNIYYYWTFIPKLDIFIACHNIDDKIINIQNKMEAYRLIDNIRR